MSHANNCILREPCKLANSETCNRRCPSYITLHGYDGRGGRIGAAGVPSEYRMLTVKNSPARAEQERAYKIIDAYVSTFGRQFEDNADEPVKSLYLYSEAPGTGKTTTAAAVLNEYLIAHYIGSLKRNRQALERPVYFLDVNAWQTDFNAFNRPRVPEEVAAPAGERYYRAQRIAMSVPFLVADDIGVRDATDAFRADLHAIINGRVTAGLPTVFTSNVPLTELDRVFDPRLYDRIRDLCVTILFEGTSKRGMR
ncbi:DNA replication protein [Paenibacillus sediminis]